MGFGAVRGFGQVAHQQQAIFHAHLAVVVAASLPASAGDAEIFLQERRSGCVLRFGGGAGRRIDPQVSKFGDSLLFGREIGDDTEDNADLAGAGQRAVGPFADILGVDEDAEVGAEGFDAQPAKVREIAQTGRQPAAFQRLQILAAFGQQPELDLAAVRLDADMVVVPFLAVWGAQVAATQQQPCPFGPGRRNAQVDFEIEVCHTHCAVFGRYFLVGCVRAQASDAVGDAPVHPVGVVGGFGTLCGVRKIVEQQELSVRLWLQVCLWDPGSVGR